MSSSYSLLREAVASKKVVKCVYHGAPREVCVHVIGRKNGRQKVLTWQFGGRSNSRPLPPNGEWRCMFVDEISSIELHDGRWRTGGSHTQPQTCVDEIDLEVDY